MPQHPGPLGWIEPINRTKEQENAHNDAMSKLVRHAIPPVTLNKGDKILLTDFWKKPEIIQKVGVEFTGFGQKTGSCVGVSEGNLITTLSMVQYFVADAPTDPFICFWPFPYGRCRMNEGDRGQGEGAVDSVMGTTIEKDGYFAITEAGLPGFTKGPDGFWIEGGSTTEYKWSDGAKISQNFVDLAKQHVGAKTDLYDTEGIKNAVANGYPVIDGCDCYVGNGRITGTGDNAYVVGKYDGRGGHSTCFVGVWLHPNDGLLLGYSNQWPTSTYPKDPAGLGRCCVWLPESEVAKGFKSYGMNGGETMALSHVNWFPRQVDKILRCMV